MPLRIIIVGGGIAGLAAAIGFARHGHNVRVFERRNSMSADQSGSGILLQSNVEHILEEWAMLEDLNKAAHRIEKLDFISYDEGKIVEVDLSGRRSAYYGLRRPIRDVFKESAIHYGAEIVEDVRVASIDVVRPAVRFQDGETAECDLIVGADGSGSLVRSVLFPNFKPDVQDMACFQVVLPLARNDPELHELTTGLHGMLTMSPGRNIYSSPVPRHDAFVIEFVDHEYSLDQDPYPNLLNGWIEDLTWLRQRWSDHKLPYRKALDLADHTFKWRLVMTRNLPSWSSGDGKVVLLGDACHSMTPYSGHGAGMGVEDAAVLTGLLSKASTGEDLTKPLTAFEKLRRPRVERVQELAMVRGILWSLKDPAQIRERNEGLRYMGNDGHGEEGTCRADMNAPFHSPAFNQWLDDYNAFEQVRELQFLSGNGQI